MHIIGTKSYGHDESFCYLKNGEILFFCEEERFNRRKKSWHYTTEGLEYIKKKFSIGPKDKVLLNHFHDLNRFVLVGKTGDYWSSAQSSSQQSTEHRKALRSVLLSRDLLTQYGFENAQVL